MLHFKRMKFDIFRSAAVLLPLIIIPVIITLVLVFYPRFPSKQAELLEYARRQATAEAFVRLSTNL